MRRDFIQIRICRGTKRMKVKLFDVCDRGTSNYTQKDLDKLYGEYPIYGAGGFIKNIDTYQQDKEYIAVVKDGAGIGRTMFLPAKSSVIGTLQYILPKNNIEAKFLYYVIKAMHLERFYTGTTIPHIYFKDYQQEEFELPDKTEQKQIIRIFENLEGIIKKRQYQLQELDTLIKSRFVEMFGDPVRNSKGWVKKPFLDMGNCKNGMNFHYEDTGIEINCLSVGDFKDLTSIDNVEKLPKVSLDRMPPEEYLLKDGDIVFVRSNGNKALVGRSVTVYPGDVPTTFSGFCIRYRKTEKAISVPYLLRVLKTDSMRQKMVGRGANIQNLNQQILGTLEIPVPPIELQNQFAAFAQQTDKLKVA